MRSTCTVEGCDKPVNGQGLCSSHYMASYSNGSLHPLPKPTTEQRFWRQVEKTETCWLWTGATSNGYGRLSLANRKSAAAHRWLWTQMNGELAPELFVCHRCDVRNCVRPEHLFIGTNTDNMRDMIEKGRSFSHLEQRDACSKGHPFDEANTKWYVKDGYRSRYCRECRRINGAARRARRHSGELRGGPKPPHPSVVQSSQEEKP